MHPDHTHFPVLPGLPSSSLHPLSNPGPLTTRRLITGPLNAWSLKFGASW